MIEKAKEENKDSSKITNRFIDFLFSNDSRKYLLLIFLLGIILRFVVANNVAPSVADEMVHGSHAIGIIGSGAISHQNECPVWFYLTDIAYKIFGVNAFSARFLSFLFGSLTIILLYLITKKIFNEKVALISSFLLAISSYYIRYTLMEMDEAMIFFVLLSFYCFINGLDNKKVSYLSFIFMAVAVLIKPIAIPFIPVFAVYFLVLVYKEKDTEKRKEFLRKNYKRIILGSLMFLVFMSPVLVYNYLLYKEKGISDIIFARFFNISPEIYSGLIGGAGQKFSLVVMFTQGFKFLGHAFLKLDPLITILGLLGIIGIFLSKNKLAKLFLSFHVITFSFLLGTQLLETHFVIFMVPLSFSAGFLIDKALESFKIPNSKKIICILLFLILLFNLYLLWPNLINKSAIFKGRSLTIDEVHENDIVVADSRIYRGRIVFMFHDKHYLESVYFWQVLQQTENLSGTKIPVKVYFVECLPDDCGWGTIYNQPEFNQSNEEFFSYIKNNSQKISTIIAGSSDFFNNAPYFNVYSTIINMNPLAYQMIDNTHQWFYYPVMWKGERYDKYALDTFPKILLHNLAYFILWLAIGIAILSPIFLVYELSRES